MAASIINQLNLLYDTLAGVIERTNSASSRYNCHGYTWHMSENTISSYPIWIGRYNPFARDVYMTDGSYDTVPFGFASKVVYEGHSAIIINHADSTCESKWGVAPRFKHHINWLPEHNFPFPPPYVCVAKPITMEGSSNLSNLNTALYNIQSGDNISGASYSWTVGPFLTITSGQGTGSCTVSKTYRFPGNSNLSWVSVSMVRYGDTLVFRKDINLGSPQSITISGPTSVCSSSSASYTVNNTPSGATIVWSSSTGLTRTSTQGSIQCSFIASGSGNNSVSAVVTYMGLTYTATLSSISVLSLPVPSAPSLNVVGASGSQGNYSTSLNGSTVYFTLYGANGNSYGWDTWGISSSYEITGNALDLIPDEVGQNMISGYVYNSCHQSQRTSAYLEVTEGRSLQGEPSLELSPNPAGDFVDITITFDQSAREPSSYTMEIINSGSQVVISEVLSGIYNRVNIQNLQVGLYIVRIRYGNTVLSEQLIVN